MHGLNERVNGAHELSEESEGRKRTYELSKWDEEEGNEQI